jgi:hypothetical protein
MPNPSSLTPDTGNRTYGVVYRDGVLTAENR